MKDEYNIEFEHICEDILNNEKFKSLDKELHHGITRYQHSIHVAKLTYVMLRHSNNKNLERAVRAALLHDFYNDSELVEYNKVEKLSKHPFMALENAKKYFDINEMQEDIIVNHMFPSTKNLPKTKEGKIVSMADKMVAMYEMTHYKTVMQLGVMLIFLFNVISVQN